jgi:hypothetical protein
MWCYGTSVAMTRRSATSAVKTLFLIFGVALSICLTDAAAAAQSVLGCYQADFKTASYTGTDSMSFQVGFRLDRLRDERTGDRYHFVIRAVTPMMVARPVTSGVDGSDAAWKEAGDSVVVSWFTAFTAVEIAWKKGQRTGRAKYSSDLGGDVHGKSTITSIDCKTTIPRALQFFFE